MRRVFENFKKYRFLLVELIKKDIKLKYRNSYLGLLWTLLEPLLMMLVLTLVFSGSLGRGDRLYPIYILTGRLLYTYFSTTTKSALKSIRSNSGMIKKVYVPKYMYPVSSVISGYVIFLLSLIVLIAVGAVLKVKPTIYIFQAIVPLTLLFVMTLGVSLILATLAVFFRDLEYLWTVALMLIMYASAIFYHVEDLNKPHIEAALKLNPLYALILNFRNSVLYGKPLDMEAVVIAAVFGLLSVIVGGYMFYKNQDKFILHI
ncbi:MAG: ABC transporter permease [Lachnospiraceae bacterium]|nr:ABC transporter permease [Lachnospiraceae bacterium]